METTVNIHVDSLTTLSLAAQSRGISRSKLAVILIKMLMDDIHEPIKPWRMVRYQKKADRHLWRRLHLQLREDDYEYLLDLRKILKMSVSRLLAYAIKRFLNRLMKNKVTDNYQYHNYMVIREIIDSVICWKFIWGFPPNPEKLLPFRKGVTKNK
ncbi:MAG: hypothetical protein JW807_04385 [Spirochaetes bacterium]|nr:hypothetical protein [Spirochaetota bacterium]